MPADKTRISDDVRQGYRGPVMQQGRVILDRDFNALEETLSDAIDADALDIIGPCGTPDDGFAISIPRSSPPALHPLDFLINPGTMYVGGLRVRFPAPAAGQPLLSYFNQPDWPAADQPGNSDRAQPDLHTLAREFVFLHLLEQEVSAVEDTELKDVALGGPDTTQRLRLVRRVRRLPVVANDCATALEQAEIGWRERGFLFDPNTMQLVPRASLKVSFTQAQTAADPCDPTSKGGYLGADNQLVRVQLSEGDSGSPVTLLWGYDNASFIHRAAVSADGITVQLSPSPVDAFHSPQAGQTVEIVRTAVVLGSEPDETDPTGTAEIMRCVAGATGFVCAVATAYDPSTGNVVLNQKIPAEYTNDANPLFLRVWRAQLPIDAGGGTVELTDTVGQGSAANPVTTGLKVTIAPLIGRVLPLGAYWSIAVRPSTPQGVYPESLLIAPQPPDGPRQWVCPLAVIDWRTDRVEDCRKRFENLVDLTRRKPGCCDVTVRPEDLADDPDALQKAVDQFAGAGQGAAVCLTPGTYWLTKPLQLDSRHTGLTIECCHGGATIEAAANAKLSLFLHGLFVLAGSNGITLSGILFVAPAVPLAAAIAGLPNLTNLQSVAAGLDSPNMMIAVRLLDSEWVKIIGCKFQIDTGSANGGSLLAAMIFANGNCTGLSVRQSHFWESAPATRTIGAEIEELTSPLSVAFHADMKVDEAVEKPIPAAESAAAFKESTVSVQSLLAADAANNHATILNGGLNQKLTGTVITELPKSTFIPPWAPPPPPPSMTLAAFLIAPSIDATFNYNGTLIGGLGSNEAKLLSLAVLDDAEFVENKMQGLSVGILGTAACGTVIFSNNEIKNCVGGIWLGGLGATDPVADAGYFQAALLLAVQQGVAAGVAMAIAMWYPLPQPSTSTTAQLSPQFHVDNNRIDALPSGNALSGPACLLSVSTPPALLNIGVNPSAHLDPYSSIIVNSNHLRNYSDTTATGLAAPYGATVLLVNASDNLASGNLIRNLAATSSNGSSVFSIVVLPVQGTVSAAAANVLGGSWV